METSLASNSFYAVPEQACYSCDYRSESLTTSIGEPEGIKLKSFTDLEIIEQRR
jgi:hypothetical protein